MTQATKPKSDRDRVLTALEKGIALTQDTARYLGMGSRLGARICELRKRGHPILREMREVQRADGKTTRVAAYYLDKQF